MDNNGTYLMCYFIIILYFVMLGCYMLGQRENLISTHGEQQSKRRMTQSVGIFMLIWAFQCILYLPSILDYGYDIKQQGYDTCFLLTVTLNTPAVFVVMFATIQKKVNTVRWIALIGLPFVTLTAWHIVMPAEQSGRLPIHIAAVLVIADMTYLCLRYIREYKIYVQRLLTEYSEISGREIAWAWSCFAGFALQALLYVTYQFFWSTTVEYLYMGFSILNATYLCHCTCRQKTLDTDIVEDTLLSDVQMKDKNTEEEKAFYSIVEQKLQVLCEAKYLYLEPDLTRESLCLRLSIGRTYLSLYLRSRGLTFYQYINSLRVDYAVKLMQENSDMSIKDVCKYSGFRSQTTFRKVFEEVMGCLPSEVKMKERPNGKE